MADVQEKINATEPVYLIGPSTFANATEPVDDAPRYTSSLRKRYQLTLSIYASHSALIGLQCEPRHDFV